MKLIKDNLLLLIFLTALLQTYIISTRGDWTTRIIQENTNSGDKYKFSLTENLSIESEHFINLKSQTIGSATYFVSKRCFNIDSLSIKLFQIINNGEFELKKTKTRLADINQIEFDPTGNIKEESLLKSEKIEICPGRQRIEITNWFEYPDKKESHFIIKYFIRTSDKEEISGKAVLNKKSGLEIYGRGHYDFIILLYPVLWVLLGLLITIKIVKALRK